MKDPNNEYDGIYIEDHEVWSDANGKPAPPPPPSKPGYIEITRGGGVPGDGWFWVVFPVAMIVFAILISR